MTDLLIIGGGPAGLAAAIEAATYGLSVRVIDDNPRMGGQLCKQTHKFFGSTQHYAGCRGFEIANELIRKAEALNIELSCETRALGVLDDGSIACLNIAPGATNGWEQLQARSMLIATGARENALVFPGCTLPGVMGAGAAQTFANQHGVLVGKRILVIGSGNVGLIVAYQLMQAGAEIAGIVEAAPKVGGYAVHAGKIRRAGVPFFLKHTIAAAKGTDQVESAVIAQIDENYKPIEGTYTEIPCDTVLIAVGLSPRTELAMMLNLPMTFNGRLGGHIPAHDNNMQTALPAVYVAGDAAGVEEASIALVEGQLAGVSAAAFCGASVPPERAEELRKDLERLRNKPPVASGPELPQITLSDQAPQNSRPLIAEEEASLKDADPIVCRCEELRRSEILEAIAAGCTSVQAIRRYTRAGMGACQGRTCGRMIERMLKEAGVQEIIPGKPRYPVVPCTFADMEVQS